MEMLQTERRPRLQPKRAPRTLTGIDGGMASHSSDPSLHKARFTTSRHEASCIRLAREDILFTPQPLGVVFGYVHGGLAVCVGLPECEY